MAPDTPPEADNAAGAVAEEIGFARRLLRRVGGRLAIVFLCIALPLWTFGELAEDVLEAEPFAFDQPILLLMRSLAGPEADAFFLVVSALGFGWGVIPLDIALVLVLTLKRRAREATFAALAIGGSALLNMAAKRSFQRDRPALWESIAPETTYSFPSGHAMGSATLACVLVVLAWRTRARVAFAASCIVLVALVGASRVYLGVHYPSDILAGWAAAVAWTVGVAIVVRPGVGRDHRRPLPSGSPRSGRVG